MTKTMQWLTAVLATTALWGCGGSDNDTAQPPAARLNYPVTQATDTQDSHFGQELADPYRWLENTQSTPVIDWVRAQNALSTQQIESQPFYNAVHSRLTQLQPFTSVSVTNNAATAKSSSQRRVSAASNTLTQEESIGGSSLGTTQVGVTSQGKFYYQWSQKRQNSTHRYAPATDFESNAVSVDNKIYVANSQNQSGEVLLDVSKVVTTEPNDHIELSSHNVTPDGKYLFFLLKRNYADLSELHYVRLDALQSSLLVSAHVLYAKFRMDGQSVIWTNADDVSNPNSSSYSKQSIRRRTTGSPSNEVLFAAAQNQMLGLLGIKDGQLYFTTSSVAVFDKLYSLDLASPSALATWMSGDGVNSFRPLSLPDANMQFYAWSSTNSAYRRLVLVDLKSPDQANWQHILPSSANDVVATDLMQSCTDSFYAVQWVDGSHNLVRYPKNGQAEQIALPGRGFIASPECRLDDLVYFYSTLAVPTQLYKYSATSHTARLLEYQTYPDYDPTQYEVKYLQATGQDQVAIPLTLVHRKDMPLNGQATALIYAYGGFDLPIAADFDQTARVLPLIENGGVYVVAHVRGGAEKGSAWYDAGRIFKKQNTYDDVATVARYLISQGYTSATRLGVTGASNGGTTSAAVALQHPELIAAAIPRVGVHDLVRFPLFTSGYGWVSDYGNPNIEAEFRNLMKFSPLHNVKAQPYPAIYVMTAENDQRVLPGHSYKLAATLQNTATGTNPYLLHSFAKSGHFMEGESTRASAHLLTFLFAQTQTSYKGTAPRNP